ncbi:unnamed protein product [Musa hybrid cultivar]
MSLRIYLLEGAEGCQNGASNPNTVLPLGGSNHLNLHAAWRQRRDLLAHPVSNAWEHGGSSAQHDVAIQILPDVHIALHDGVVGGLVYACSFHPDHGRLEEDFRAAEPLGADGDHLPVRQLVVLLHRRAGLRHLQLLLVVESDVGQLLLDVTDDFTLRRGGEGVAALRQDLHESVGEVAARQVEAKNRVRECVAFVDRNRVADTVAGVEHNAYAYQHNSVRANYFRRCSFLVHFMASSENDRSRWMGRVTCRSTTSIKREDSLDGDIHRGSVEGLEHDLSHLLTIRLGVERRLGEQNGVFFGGDAELVVEGVVPNLLHVVPVAHDAVLDRVLERQNASLGLSFVSHVRVLLPHAYHHAGVAWSTHDAREDSSRGIISSKTSLQIQTQTMNHISSTSRAGLVAVP